MFQFVSLAITSVSVCSVCLSSMRLTTNHTQNGILYRSSGSGLNNGASRMTRSPAAAALQDVLAFLRLVADESYLKQIATLADSFTVPPSFPLFECVYMLVCFICNRNNSDDESFERVLNVPPRGIGAQTVEALQTTATAKHLSLAAAAQTHIRTPYAPCSLRFLFSCI